MAFRKKYHKILELKPDLIIVIECENEKRLNFGKLTPTPKDFIWYGENPNKGVGIFSYSNLTLRKYSFYNPDFKFIIPIQISGAININLFAIWAMPNKEKYEQRYIGQVWSGIQFYQKLLDEDVIIIGDFNWNKIWDYVNNLTGNLSALVKFLETRNIKSVYHLKRKENFGGEKTPTFYLHRNYEKPFHIDYCMVNESLLKKGVEIKIGNFENWIRLSDHMPLIVDLNT